MGRVTKRARGTIARRVVAAIASAALVLSQALGALAPAVAYASTGTMRVTTETNGGEGFLSFGSDSGSQLFCISPEAHNPTGTTFTRWDYTGEATGILPDPHALAYLVHSMAPGNPLGLERPDQAINVAVWMLCGMDVDLSSGAYSVGRMSGNVYSGAGGRASRADAGKIQAAVADARAHAGKAGAWDRASKVWYSPNGTVQSVVEVLPTGGVELTKSSANHEVSDGQRQLLARGRDLHRLLRRGLHPGGRDDRHRRERARLRPGAARRELLGEGDQAREELRALDRRDPPHGGGGEDHQGHGDRRPRR
ncbi:MAG: hypothetical protein LKF00_05785 [Olsenella sp.]|nr:hypothetical protein [Olsenella sp.]